MVGSHDHHGCMRELLHIVMLTVHAEKGAPDVCSLRSQQEFAMMVRTIARSSTNDIALENYGIPRVNAEEFPIRAISSAL